MLINKWIVIDTLSAATKAIPYSGLCLDIGKHLKDISAVYQFAQKELTFLPFTILLYGDVLDAVVANNSLMEDCIGLFFQPSYYMVNEQPVIFFKSPIGDSAALNMFQDKCRRQGFENILLVEIEERGNRNTVHAQYGYWVTRTDINFDSIIKEWLAQYLDNANPSEIHFLIPANMEGAAEIFDRIQAKENLLKETEAYKIANAFYEKTREIEAYRHQLTLKSIDEKNNQLYLSIQKAERANALEWYHYEYEILPLWYKQFGHIIKMLTGKRTFKSLFDDSVKKYKD